MKEEPEDALTPQEVAKIFHCDPRTVSRYTSRKHNPLPVTRLSKRKFLYSRKAVLEFKANLTK